MFIASLYNLKGGVGKTASCVNFAYMAAKDGFKTLLWDLDPQGAASFYYNATAPRKATAKKIVTREMSLQDAIVMTNYDNLDIIPADISARKLDILLEENSASKKQISNLLRPLNSVYDFVFIDCPPGFSILADNIFYASDAVLMPVIPTTLSLRTYEIVKKYFEDKEVGIEKLMCFFTMVDIRKTMHNEIMQHLYKDKRFFEYYIPYLSDIEKMGMHGAPLETFAASGYAATCYRALWNEIKEGVL
ncbi:MAG TPA: AAA family ATPase [Flavipsychrobacter sp.]|nr:AAA family ATPase [Flavipsychrobacter sp.]